MEAKRPMRRQSYDGVVAVSPVTVPYARYSIKSAHWWIGRALKDLLTRSKLEMRDIDGLSVSSFTMGPDTAIALTQHFGVSPRWLDHVPLGGASGVVALRRAARAVQAGDADLVACVAGDTNHVDSFRRTVANFSRFAQDAVYPYGAGGPNASFALITRHYMQRYGATREDFGHICVAQRQNALAFPMRCKKSPSRLPTIWAPAPLPTRSIFSIASCLAPVRRLSSCAAKPPPAPWNCLSCAFCRRSNAIMLFPRIRSDPAAAGRWMSRSSMAWPMLRQRMCIPADL